MRSFQDRLQVLRQTVNRSTQFKQLMSTRVAGRDYLVASCGWTWLGLCVEDAGTLPGEPAPPTLDWFSRPNTKVATANGGDLQTFADKPMWLGDCGACEGIGCDLCGGSGYTNAAELDERVRVGVAVVRRIHLARVFELYDLLEQVDIFATAHDEPVCFRSENSLAVVGVVATLDPLMSPFPPDLLDHLRAVDS